MKKIVLAMAVVFSVAMVSCSGNKAAENADSDTVVAVEETAVVEEVADSNAPADSAAVEAPAEAPVAE